MGKHLDKIPVCYFMGIFYRFLYFIKTYIPLSNLASLTAVSKSFNPNFSIIFYIYINIMVLF